MDRAFDLHVGTFPIAMHELPFSLPTWLGSWFEVYAYYETIAAQLLAAGLVIGSYYLAEYLKVTRPLKHGEQPAVRATSAPDRLPAATASGMSQGGAMSDRDAGAPAVRTG